VGIGEISLEWCGLNGIDRQNRNQHWMSAEWFFVRSDDAAASFLDGFGDNGGASCRLV
jgi:hypothetical protein